MYNQPQQLIDLIATYTPNNLNQYSSRTVPDHVDVLGLATPAATVSVNGTPVPYRRGEYFWSELSVANSSAVYPSINVTAVNGASSATPETGNIFVPPATETFTHDYDGNLIQDGRWVYTWDAENRLVKLESLSTGPSGSRRRLEFEYDARGRRIRKKATDLGTATVLGELKMVYDGWNLLAELNVSGGALVRSYVWGLDLNDSLQGAGGVGGLLFVKDTTSVHAAAYDGNGNVTGLVNMASGATSASYEYGPFGEMIRSSGALANANPFRFSTKYQDDESGLLYYGYRYYTPSKGRWLNPDPIQERGGKNLYGFVRNQPITNIDKLGLQCWGWGGGCGVPPPGAFPLLPPACAPCGNKTYNPNTHCCCNGKITSRKKVPTAVKFCVAPIHGMSLGGAANHGWIEIDGIGIDSACGGLLEANIGDASDYIDDPKKSCIPVELSPCEYDIAGFEQGMKDLIKSILASPKGWIYNPMFSNCFNFGADLIDGAKSAHPANCQ